MTHNFTTGTKNFFIAQGIGWSIFGTSNIIVQSITGLPLDLVAANAGFAILSGFSATTAYRYLVRRWDWQSWRLWKLLVFIAFSSLVLAVAYLVSAGLLFQIIKPEYHISVGNILSNLMVGCLLFAGWNLVYFFFKYFVKYQQSEVEKWRLAAEVKEAQLGTLRSQIRPHFVFNTLNNIKALVLEDPHRSREMLINFSDLLRYSLQHDQGEMVTLENEIEIIRQYLELMTIQYEDRLRWHIDAPPETLSAQLPPMLLHLLVENAVKHGISPSANGGDLVISAVRSNGELQVEVKNTGSLVSRSNVEGRLGTGLKNIRERLRIFYGEAAKFELKEVPPNVVARLVIPVVGRFISPQKNSHVGR